MSDGSHGARRQCPRTVSYVHIRVYVEYVSRVQRGQGSVRTVSTVGLRAAIGDAMAYAIMGYCHFYSEDRGPGRPCPT